MRFVLGKSMGCSVGGQRPRGGARADLTSGAGAQGGLRSHKIYVSPQRRALPVTLFVTCLSVCLKVNIYTTPQVLRPCQHGFLVLNDCLRRPPLRQTVRLSRVPSLTPRALSYSANICHSVFSLHVAPHDHPRVCAVSPR